MERNRQVGKGRTGGELTMTPQSMRQLGTAAMELLIERISGLGDANAWDGEFRQVLQDRLPLAPPETGRPAEEVLNQVAHDVLPFAARLDHPRFFGFVPSSPTWPSVVADFPGRRLQHQLVHLASVERHQPTGVDRRGLDARLAPLPEDRRGLLTSGGSAASVEALVAAPGVGRTPRAPSRLHERPVPRRPEAGGLGGRRAA